MAKGRNCRKKMVSKSIFSSLKHYYLQVDLTYYLDCTDSPVAWQGCVIRRRRPYSNEFDEHLGPPYCRLKDEIQNP